MTNREWLLNKMQNMSDEELGKIISVNFDVMDCEKTDAVGECDGNDCYNCQARWLKAEHKKVIKLSEAERVILANMAEDCKWIVRDSNGVLKIYYTKPMKKTDTVYWYIPSGHIADIPQYNHLFQFIQWSDSEPYNIEELLKCGD